MVATALGGASILLATYAPGVACMASLCGSNSAGTDLSGPLVAASRAFGILSIMLESGMERAYRTLKTVGTSELEIKRSRFLGRAEPIGDELGFQQLLTLMRTAHPDARHHAYAFRLGRAGEVARFSDDGEPGGTAGRPAMEALLRDEVVDGAVVVTRYFGGTLLGSGGLTRAYSQAAAEAIRAAGIVSMRPHTEMHVVIDYEIYGALEQTLKRAGLSVGATSFADVVTVAVRVPAGQEPRLVSLVADLTAGAGLVEPGSTMYLPS